MVEEAADPGFWLDVIMRTPSHIKPTFTHYVKSKALRKRAVNFFPRVAELCSQPLSRNNWASLGAQSAAAATTP
jgi:hypothetical protein